MAVCTDETVEYNVGIHLEEDVWKYAFKVY